MKYGLGIAITKEFNFPKMENSKLNVEGKGFELKKNNLKLKDAEVIINPGSYNEITIDNEGKSKVIFYSNNKSKYKKYVIRMNVNGELSVAYLSKNAENVSNEINSYINGKLNLFFADLDNGLSISKINSRLLSENAELNQISVLYGDKDNQILNDSVVVHENKATRSNLIVKGVVKDKSKAIVKGLVHIKKSATKSKGFQKEDIILLGNESEADPIPELQIDTNDVECKHGATVGRVDNNKLFYLTSRGISDDDAKNLIISGFFDSVLSNLTSKIADEIRCKYERQ